MFGQFCDIQIAVGYEMEFEIDYISVFIEDFGDIAGYVYTVYL